jgi:hypothetical protein
MVIILDHYSWNKTPNISYDSNTETDCRMPADTQEFSQPFLGATYNF